MSGSQTAAVLSLVMLLAILVMRGDRLDTGGVQFCIKCVTVIRPVADDTLRRLVSEHEVEQPLHKLGFVGTGRGRIDGNWPASRIHPNHDFRALSDSRAANAVAAALGFAEDGVDRAFVQTIIRGAENGPRLARESAVSSR
jgi:hypothetical protein